MPVAKVGGYSQVRTPTPDVVDMCELLKPKIIEEIEKKNMPECNSDKWTRLKVKSVQTQVRLEM